VLAGGNGLPYPDIPRGDHLWAFKLGGTVAPAPTPVPPSKRNDIRTAAVTDVTTVTLSVPASSKAVALFQHVSIKRGAQGALALPIRWTDNDVTLWPGESIVLTARYAAQGTADPVVEVSGWNVPVQSVAAGATHSTDH